MPGSYDDLAALVRREAEADAVVLVVIEGKRGTGVSVTTNTSAGREVHESIHGCPTGPAGGDCPASPE